MHVAAKALAMTAVDALTDTDPLDLILPAAKALHRC